MKKSKNFYLVACFGGYIHRVPYPGVDGRGVDTKNFNIIVIVADVVVVVVVV